MKRRSAYLTRLISLLIVLAVLMSCRPAPMPTPPASMPTTAPTSPPAAPTSAPTSQPSTSTAVPTPLTSAALVYRDASQPIEKRVDDLLARMTLAEKIGQMTQVEHNSLRPEQVRQYAIGSVLSGGDSIGDDSAESWRSLVESYEKEAQKTRLSIPLIYGIDAVHGHAHVEGATIFPHNIGLGATRDAALVERIGRATAEEVAATGMQWNFAPVVAVPQDIRWGRTYEGYSENTDLVTQLGMAYVKGLQSVNGKLDLSDPTVVLATPKHFIADGGTRFGTSTTVIQQRYLLDQGDARMDEATLRALFLPPYKAAVDAGAQSVMASFSSWNGTKMHANKHLLTDVLKGELGFKGYVVSDWGGIDQISPDYNRAVITAINAGVDMNMVPYDYKRFIDTLTRAVNKGDVPMSRIDDAVRRILTVKFERGLFDHPLADPAALSKIGSQAHRELAREAVRKSLVLLKNENNTLPLKKDTPVIFVGGEAADRTGYQGGGWTTDWQGTTLSLGGTSILQAVKQAVSPTTRVEYNRFGKFESITNTQGQPLVADIGIAVVGEAPYAEGVGDRADLTLSSEDANLVQRVKSQSKKVVVILISGRPMVVTEQLPAWDALVAAWLPGTEGEGVTDVLFGDAPFTGKLPYTWPRWNQQLPFDFKNLPKEGCDAPLFPFGYGLSANDPSPQQLSCPRP